MINRIGPAGFACSALSPDNARAGSRQPPVRPHAQWPVLGEGAGFLVLREWEARRRGAAIHAELAGESSSPSSYRITDAHPSGDGPIRRCAAPSSTRGCAPRRSTT
jgi:3-oxoacyl-(acyl-carrier-protein) synthase